MSTKYLYEISKSNPAYNSFMRAHNLDLGKQNRSRYDKLIQYHSERINNYLRYKSSFFNAHMLKLSNATNPNPVVRNSASTIVKKHAAFLMGKGFLVESDFIDIEKFLQNNWFLNTGGIKEHNLFGYTMAVEGGLTGDVWVKYGLSTSEVGERYIKYSVLKSENCYPVISNGVLIGFLYYGKENVLKDLDSGFSSYSDISLGTFYGRGYYTIIQDEVDIETVSLDYLDLPVIHTKNFPTVYDYGISDIADTLKLINTFDVLLTKFDKIIKYHADPVTVITGAKATDLEKGANRVWSIMNKDAKVTNLKLDTDLAALQKLIEYIDDSIKQTANVPEGSLGKINNMSNTSGSAIAITFMPLFEVMDLKRILYGSTLLKLNTATIKLGILTGLLNVNKIIHDRKKRWEGEFSNYSNEIKNRNKPFRNMPKTDIDYNSLNAFYDNLIPSEIYETYITWFPPLPRDEKMLAELVNMNVKNNIWSLRHGRSVLGMPERESLLMEREIKEQSNYIVMTNKESDASLSGDPDVKGETESLRKQDE